MRWEFIKYKIRQFTINYSKEKASERKARRISLEKTVKRLEISLSTNSSETLLEEYYKYKNELESIYNFIAEGIILCSKANWYEHGEKSSKYFLNLEKRNKAKSHLQKIIYSDGQEMCDETEIRQKLKQFYSSLYKRRSTKTVDECMSYLANMNIPKLKVEEQLSCEGKLTKNECWNVLSSMGSNMSPWNDGFSEEFYVCFFVEIHKYLLESLNYSFIHGQLSHSQCQAMITLIEKKGKDKRFLKNWRPISPINVDAKLTSKCLALGIRNVLSSLIHSD